MQEIIDVRFHRLQVVGVRILCGQNNEKRVLVGAGLANAPAEFKAIDLRHGPVADDDGWIVRAKTGEALLPVGSDNNLMPQPTQGYSEPFARDRVILCN